MRLACHDIRYRYPGSENDLFRGLGFALEEPGFHAVFGPSGVGKTSLARLLTGDIDGFSGDVEAEGLPARLYSHNLERLPGWSSVGKHLSRITPPGREEQRETLVEAFGLTGFMDSRFSRLSLGQRNRVNLLRYLIQDFQLLIMDESLANVDEQTREQILLSIKEMFPKACFLYISHNVVEVATFCRRILVLRSPEKSPQAVVVSGQDRRKNASLDERRLQQSMLEIVNAS
jgi:ABC-type nitrate/sulfonate/bicarbonate transport system ATPase subunit